MVLLLDLGGGADVDVSLAGHIRLIDPGGAVDIRPRRKIGAFDELHELAHARVGVIHQIDGAVDDLAEVMRGDIGRHTDGDTDRAVDEEVRKPRGQDGWFAAGIVEVHVPLDDVLFDVAHHLVGELGQSRLGVPVRGRRVSVDGTEVAVALDEGIAVGERLCHTYHGEVDGGVAVGMVPAEHVTDGGSGFAERLIGGEVVLVHGVEDAPLAGLHAVAGIRQCAGHDDGHGVLDKGLSDLFFHIDRNDLLFREGEVDELVPLTGWFFFCHFLYILFLPACRGYLPNLFGASTCSLLISRGRTMYGTCPVRVRPARLGCIWGTATNDLQSA